MTSVWALTSWASIREHSLTQTWELHTGNCSLLSALPDISKQILSETSRFSLFIVLALSSQHKDFWGVTCSNWLLLVARATWSSRLARFSVRNSPDVNTSLLHDGGVLNTPESELVELSETGCKSVPFSENYWTI